MTAQMYGFEGEVKAKYSSLMVDLFTEVYNWLPLCHLLDSKVLVMHGGLFAKVRTVLARVGTMQKRRIGHTALEADAG